MKMKLTYPTLATAKTMQAWGNKNAQLYPGGRHMGIDIGGHVGNPLYAVCDGAVEVVNLFGAHGYGRHVIIQHDGFKTLYAHMHKVFVTKGQDVTSGMLIGEIGGDPTDDDPIDGASSGAHLHFEVILPAEPKTDFVKTFAGWTVDPFPYLVDRYLEPAPFIGTVTEKTGLRVRDGHSTKMTTILTALPKDQSLEIAEFYEDPSGDTWARLRAIRPEWCCVIYQGKKYVEWKPVPVVIEPTSPPPALEDIRAIRLDEINKLIAYLEARRNELSE